jgi:hypothetical protein
MMSAESDNPPALATCRLCDAETPQLYSLPEKVTIDRYVSGPSCYFCYVRVVGIRPTRRQRIPV